MAVTRKFLALDSASNREYDADFKRLKIYNNRLTQDQVAPYLGREIPDARERGLDPDRIYYAWRNPDELSKALDSFNGVPLLIKHRMDTGTDNDKEIRVGTVGTNARWEPPYLINDLYVWDEKAVKSIEDESLRDLSCGYSYVADWTSGKTPEGLEYDFVMRDIHCNHVALVADGRAPDCMVNDSLPEEIKMEKEVNKNAEAKDEEKKEAESTAKDEDVEVEAKAEDEDEVKVEAKAEDEDVEEKKEAEDACAKDEDKDDEKKSGAMDANAIAELVRGKLAKQFEAGEAVKPFIGSVRVMSFDSSEAIYAEALKQMGYKGKYSCAEDAFTALASVKRAKSVAQDEKPSAKSGVANFFSKRFNH